MARLRGCAKFASVFVGFLSLSGCLSGGGVTGSDASSSQSSLDAGLPIGAAVPVGAQLSVPAYSGSFGYGFNPGYYGNGFSDNHLYQLGLDAGAHTMRASLPDSFILQYGPQIRVPNFQFTQNTLGFTGNTVFIGTPADSDRDPTPYVSGKPSQLWAGMYLPIWADEANRVVNPANKLAVYVSKVVQNYGAYVQFWEIINEPDFTYDTVAATAAPGVAGNWWSNTPNPADLTNIQAPAFQYIRVLRVAYTVIKKFYPNSYVGPGGLGYASFLDFILRNSDNPNGGALTTSYPTTGGAYMDMVSWHIYPEYGDAHYDNSISGFVRQRFSDKLISVVATQAQSFANVLASRGYDGSRYPKKVQIVTESNVSRKQVGATGTGGIELQRNYAIKALVEAQRLGLLQWDWFSLGESEDYATSNNSFALEGLYQNLTTCSFGQQVMTTEGTANKTTSMLLAGSAYNATLSAELQLPAGVDGAAFGSGTNATYVLWAKTSVDNSEAASATYSFPAGLGLSTMTRYEWDYSSSTATANSPSAGISLTGAPSFFRP